MSKTKAKDKRLVMLLHKAVMGKSRYINPELGTNYFSIRPKTGLISYLPEGKEHKVNEDGTWDRTARQEMKPAKFIKDILHPRLLKHFKDHQFSNFATIFKTTLTGGDITFKAVSFEQAYCYSGDSDEPDENYYPDNDSLRSCMTGYPVHEFYNRFDCYALVAVMPNGKYVGRAVIWKDVKTPRNGTIVCMDRIYVTKTEYQQMFIDYAIDNGMWYKAAQNADCCTWKGPEGQSTIDSLTVEILPNKVKISDNRDDCFIAYLDSFLYGTWDGKYLKTRKSFKGNYYMLRDTDGMCDAETGDCGEWVHCIGGEEIEDCDAIQLAPDMFCEYRDKEHYINQLGLTAHAQAV